MKKNGTGTKPMLTLRRAKVAEMLAQGMTQLKIAEELDVHRNTVFSDLKAIGDDLVKDINNNSSGPILKFVLAVDNVYKKLMGLYGEADNVNLKRLILRDIREAAEQRVRVMQSLGLIQRAPEKFEHDIRQVSIVWIEDAKALPPEPKKVESKTEGH